MKLRPPTDYNKSIIEIIEGFLKKEWNSYRRWFHLLEFHDIVFLNMKAVEVYDRVHGKLHRNDVYFNETSILKAFHHVFEQVVMPINILEFGAWNGKLAALVFGMYKEKILKWNGCDICPIVQTHNQCKFPLYNPVLLLGHIWEVALPQHDLFVCSHTFEHMPFHQVKKVLEYQQAKYLVLEIPTPESRNPNWEDYEGGHVLIAAPEEIREFLFGLGYANMYASENQWTTAWERT